MSVSAKSRKRALKVSIMHPSLYRAKYMVVYDVYVRGRRVARGERYSSSREVFYIEMEDIGCRLRDDKWIAGCRRCGMDIPIEDYCSPQEWLEQDRYYDLCGGSPGCLP